MAIDHNGNLECYSHPPEDDNMKTLLEARYERKELELLFRNYLDLSETLHKTSQFVSEKEDPLGKGYQIAIFNIKGKNTDAKIVLKTLIGHTSYLTIKTDNPFLKEVEDIMGIIMDRYGNRPKSSNLREFSLINGEIRDSKDMNADGSFNHFKIIYEPAQEVWHRDERAIYTRMSMSDSVGPETLIVPGYIRSDRYENELGDISVRVEPVKETKHKQELTDILHKITKSSSYISFWK